MEFLLSLNGIAQAPGNPAALHVVYFLMPLALPEVLGPLLARPVQHGIYATPRSPPRAHESA